MRELTEVEMEEVCGGVGVVGAGIGAAIGAGSTYAGGGSAGEVISAGILGGVSGFFGGVATAAGVPALGRAMFSWFSIETGILSGAVGS
ncbi:MAG: hypothetical protein RLN96_10590 [Pseudomonadales bacterium]